MKVIKKVKVNDSDIIVDSYINDSISQKLNIPKKI